MVTFLHVKCLIARSALENRIVTLEADRDRLQHELDIMRTDYARTVELLGGVASRPQPTRLWDADPFKETDGPLDYLTPSADDIPDPRAIERQVQEPPPVNPSE